MIATVHASSMRTRSTKEDGDLSSTADDVPGFRVALSLLLVHSPVRQRPCNMLEPLSVSQETSKMLGKTYVFRYERDEARQSAPQHRDLTTSIMSRISGDAGWKAGLNVAPWTD
jgi:hypothetical protein